MILPGTGRGTIRRMVEWLNTSAPPGSDPPSTTLRAVPLPVPGRS